MTKTVLLLLIILSQFANAQTYFPFTDSSATWTVLYEYQSNPNDYYSQIYTYSQLGDTVFRNVTYHKIYRNGLYLGAIRQDTTQKSVYFHGDYNWSSAEDTLLYQFRLNIGDSIPNKFPVSNRVNIMAIDSVSIGGQYRKKYDIYYANSGFDEWIEGIGSTHFPFLPFDYEFEWRWTLICYTENGNQLYKHDYYLYQSNTLIDGCSGQILEINEKGKNFAIAVFPNPTSDQFLIDANTTDKLNVNLFDINGRHVSSVSVNDKENISVATLDNGSYTVTIKTAERVINKKLVILR